MTSRSSSQPPSHGSSSNAPAARGTPASAFAGGADARTRPAPSIPVSDTAISQADGAA